VGIPAVGPGLVKPYAGGNALYHNNGDGTFTRVRSGSLVNDVANSVGCAWADYDNDRFLDLFVANGGIVRSENNFLYHNNGNSNSWLDPGSVAELRSSTGSEPACCNMSSDAATAPRP
jgi:hypothetical protein